MSTVTKHKRLLSGKWNEFEFDVSRSIKGLNGSWDACVGGSNIFLSEEYLRAIEMAPPSGMSFFYVTVKQDNRICGVIYLQLNHFSASESLNYIRNGNSNGQKNGRIRSVVRDFVAQKIDFYTLICGNSSVTGEHAFYFINEVKEQTRLSIVDEVMAVVRDYAQEQGFDVQLLFIKDFYKQLFRETAKCPLGSHFNEFKAQPAMEMKIDPSWSSMADYIMALTSKYRVRIRRARKKAGKARFRQMTLSEIEEYEPQLYNLYRKIADKAVFNLFLLNETYFSTLKAQLGEKFQLYGCFEEGNLIAFYSMIANGDQLDAHFLGYEEEVNRQHQLYLNMLLNIVECAIEKGFASIFFARTALEIKSSVGAEPYDMYFYLQHSKGVHNKLLPHIYNLLEPREEWTPRSPFKS